MPAAALWELQLQSRSHFCAESLRRVFESRLLEGLSRHSTCAIWWLLGRIWWGPVPACTSWKKYWAVWRPRSKGTLCSTNPSHFHTLKHHWSGCESEIGIHFAFLLRCGNTQALTK